VGNDIIEKVEEAMGEGKTRELRPDIINAATKIFKLIGDPTRFLILHVLENRELNVNAIAEELDLEQSAVSHQLKKLREAKLVKSRRSGKNILYSQDDQHVYEILHLAVEHAEHGREDAQNEAEPRFENKKQP
jgi:DNA-binding transcriptional ArsR family regulator